MSYEQQLQQGIIQQTGLAVLPGVDADLFRQKLSDHINQLINNDFSKLILILYRLDISEKKLKQLLAESPGANAGNLITALIIERQLEKIQSRQKFRQPDDSIPEDERW